MGDTINHKTMVAKAITNTYSKSENMDDTLDQLFTSRLRNASNTADKVNSIALHLGVRQIYLTVKNEVVGRSLANYELSYGHIRNTNWQNL